MSTSIGVTAATEAHDESRMQSSAAAAQIVFCLGPSYEDASPEQLEPLLQTVQQAIDGLSSQVLVAYPVSHPEASSWQHRGMHLQPFLLSAKLHALSIQTATTYLSLYEIMRAHSAACGLLLGAEAHTLQPEALRAMCSAVLDGGADLVLPRYSIGANEGLINASILRPLSRAVFGVRAQFPLALDAALSNRMAERMAGAAQRQTTASQPEALLWPAAEAAVASFTVAEVGVGRRELPHPADSDLSSILNTTAASLFSDIEAKAAYWQRTRPALPMLNIEGVPTFTAASQPVDPEELTELTGSFRIGYGNLNEIWSLVLPPQTLLGLKRLSVANAGSFALSDSLWVRIVYDFVLAHRLRTINRGHLMGSFTPLYLAWVASHLAAAAAPHDPDETLARAFEADKPYLVSRWRWPDRFNP